MPRTRMKGSFKCPKCDRVFSMKAHLARHESTIHASPGARAMAATKTTMKRGKKGKKGKNPRGRIGRPTGLVTRLGLRDMSLEELRDVIDAARSEARVKIAEYHSTFA